jgi:hypothetical protein
MDVTDAILQIFQPLEIFKKQLGGADRPDGLHAVSTP